MAARAIVGIALGIFFAPIIYMLLTGTFMTWIGLITVDFNSWGSMWLSYGSMSMTAPITYVITGVMSFDLFMSTFALTMFTWVIIGMWAGAIERSAGRGIGVAAGIWLGWMIINLIIMAATGTISLFLGMLEATFYTLIIVILVAAIFGAITKSEEF
ncbi:MAG: hypothetical protein ACTSQ8_05280 [Candidatus Helarchaeota archaeon]